MENNNSNFEDRRTPRGEAQPKRLYKIEEGALISGVCSGLGVFFNIDPTIVRIIFVILTFVTHGIAIIVYLFMMIIIPYAKTPEDYAKAHGDRVNPYGEERRHESDPQPVNTRAYWQKFSKEQKVFWRDYIWKIFAPLRSFFEDRTTK